MKRFFFYYYFGELLRIKLNYVSKIITIMQINVRNVWYAWARKKKLIIVDKNYLIDFFFIIINTTDEEKLSYPRTRWCRHSPTSFNKKSLIESI